MNARYKSKNGLRVGDLVWNVNYSGDHVFRIENLTDARVVVKQIGYLTGDGVELIKKNLAKTSMAYANVFKLEPHIKVIN